VLTEFVFGGARRGRVGAGEFATDLFVVVLGRQPATARKHVLVTSRRLLDLDVRQVPRRSQTFAPAPPHNSILDVTEIHFSLCPNQFSIGLQVNFCARMYCYKGY